MLAQTCQELLEVFRAEVHDDKVYTQGDDAGCLWQDDEILRHMTEACDALAIRTRSLIEVITLSYAANATTVALPARVLHINEARLVSTDCQLTITNSNAYYRWRSCTGVPYEVYRDYDRGKLRLYPTPTEADQIELSCSVSLQVPLTASMQVPFTLSADQRLVLQYMKMLAYRKQDAEAEDLARSRAAGDDYERGVIVREQELRNQRRAPGFIQMDW